MKKIIVVAALAFFTGAVALYTKEANTQHLNKIQIEVFNYQKTLASGD